MKTVSYDRYKEAVRGNEGWCTECKEFDGFHVEPDAEGYECPMCGQPTLMGAENAMVCMEFDIVNTPDLDSSGLLADMLGVRY